jgi:hypothetical protein
VRREAGEREREGGSTTAGRERALSPRSRPRWQARRGGRRAVARRCVGAAGPGREDVTWRVLIGPRGLSVELAVI